MAMKIQFRRDTAASWTSNNPVLLEGELGLDTTNDHFKIGDGTTNWNTLAYSYGDWNTLINKPSTFTPSAGGSVGQVLTNVSNGVGTWQDAAGGVNLTSATTAPSSPTAGDQWFDTANGILYAYMTDGTQTQWLDISSANGQAAAAAAAGGGAMEFISKATISSAVSSILITLPTTYTTWKLVFNVTLSGGSKVGFKVKDNGSIYSSATYHWRVVNNGASSNYNYQQRINISSTTYNKTKHFGEILINNETEFKTFSLCNSIDTTSSSNMDVQTGGGRFYNHTLTSLEAIEFSPEANNISAGTFSLYGIKDS
jgi:hypothetical protein